MKNQPRDAKGKFIRVRPADVSYKEHMERIREIKTIYQKADRLRPAFWGSICFIAGTIFFMLISKK